MAVWRLPSEHHEDPTRAHPLAALGLIIIMVGALVWHVGRGEMLNVGFNVVNAIILAYIAYGRWRLAPIAPRAD